MVASMVSTRARSPVQADLKKGQPTYRAAGVETARPIHASIRRRWCSLASNPPQLSPSPTNMAPSAARAATESRISMVRWRERALRSVPVGS
ncbi:hypothetical protein D3C86_1386960 [compost metagenome]